MEQERVTLTLEELKRVKVMERLCAGDLSNQEAADELGICRRQIIRIKKKYIEQGDIGLIHTQACSRSSLETFSDREI